MLMNPWHRLISKTIVNAVEKRISPNTYYERRAREKAEARRTYKELGVGFLILAAIFGLIVLIRNIQVGAIQL
jgi:hypothetical protein